MPILVRNIRLGLDEPEELILARAAKRLLVPIEAIQTHVIVRRSLDARKADDLAFVYQLELKLHEGSRDIAARLHRADAIWVEPEPADLPVPGAAPLCERPIIVGFGPAGMFAALRLAQFGYRPIVLERGRDVRRRHADILQRFYRQREFNPESNLLFGEGGAGTYSDGKLYTRIHDLQCRCVLETFCQHGADPDILVDARPHIGSDRLPTICTRIRRTIESLGAEVRFECQVADITVEDGILRQLHLCGLGASKDSTDLAVGAVILAIGHSARDTIRMLHRRGMTVVPKAFQMGVRIEHPQEIVDKWQYGAAAGHRRLGPAEYHMVARKAGGPHGDMFSFCMCPGGVILPTNESHGLIATNGASRSQRSSPFANSGLVLTLPAEAIGAARSDHPAMAALDALEAWERRAFVATGGTYRVPAQRANDFIAGRSSTGELRTSYPLGGQWSSIAELVPDAVKDALTRALPFLDSRYPGFAGEEALITAPETRASAPYRLLRDNHTRQAVGIDRLYPVGEGAGYAGGIISAAVDGIKSADALIRHFAPPT